MIIHISSIVQRVVGAIEKKSFGSTKARRFSAILVEGDDDTYLFA